MRRWEIWVIALPTRTGTISRQTTMPAHRAPVARGTEGITLTKSRDPVAGVGRRGTITRRGFLQAAGATAALAATWPLTEQVAFAASTPALKIGVITVRNGGHPGMRHGFLDGIGLAFDQAAAGSAPLRAALVSRAVDGGHAGAYTAARALLAHNVNVVIAEISAPVADLLAPLFAAAGVPLVVANVGGHVVRPSDRRAQVLHSSLLLTQASYALGGWAAAYLGKRTYLLGSAADAGYDSLYAFRRGFQGAGGEVAGWSMTHERPGHSRLAAALAKARATSPDFVFGHYSGQLAVEFVKAYGASSLSGVQLAGASFLADELVLKAAGARANGIVTAASWPSAIAELGGTTPAALAFSHAYLARTGRTADAFAVLGFDAASVGIAGLRGAAGGDPKRLIRALAGQTIPSTRGLLRIDAATNTVTGDIVVRRVQVKAGKSANATVATIKGVAAFPDGLASMDHSLASGYLSEYLCS